MNCEKVSKASVCFPAIRFTEPGVYHYKIAEATPCCAIPCGSCECRRWKTDCREFRVVITVYEDCNGHLSWCVCYPDGCPEFVNRCC